MTTFCLQILRMLTGSISVLLVSMDSPLWWLAAVPWALLCFFGIVATVPLVVLIGMGAGAAQADWMSDAFIIGLVFVVPTALAVTIAELFRWWIGRGDGSYRFMGLEWHRAS